MDEFKYTHYETNKKPSKTSVLQCVELDKPIKIYTGQSLELTFSEYEDNYYLYFGQGKNFPKEKEGFAWLSDEHSIFFFERPFENKVVKLLKQLLPNANIKYDKNDIYINGTKNGASLRTGLQQQLDDEYLDSTTHQVLKRQESKPLSGMIYILRWDDLDGLNEAFKNIEHHQVRLKTKPELATLTDFIDIDKQTFIDLLEK